MNASAAAINRAQTLCRDGGLRARRKKLKLTQDQLAAEVGVSTRTVERWERGAALPKGARAVALDAVLRSTTILSEALPDDSYAARVARINAFVAAQRAAAAGRPSWQEGEAQIAAKAREAGLAVDTLDNRQE